MKIIEIWKDIKGYEWLYQISNLGKVNSLERKVNYRIKWYSKLVKWRNIKFNTSWNYYDIQLYRKWISKHFLLHRLIAIHFIPNPENKPQINHIDWNKLNNNISNLEWCNQSENMRHAHINKLLVTNNGENHWNCKLTNKQVLEIRIKYIPRFYSYSKLALEYNCWLTTIQDIIKNKTRCLKD